MKNPIKQRFQKVYDQTNIKPFTFLNCFLCIFLPIIGFFVGGTIVDSNPALGFAVMALLILGGWIGNFLILFKNFKTDAIGLFFLNMLASFAFFTKLILWPLLKASYHFGMAAWQSNLGNTTASMNASSRGGASLGSTKMSALNWFEYEGNKWSDVTQTAEVHENYALDEGSYTYEQNQRARNMGYHNAKDAQMHGADVNK